MANGLLLEVAHGDHPDYKFPVKVEFIGEIPEGTEDWEVRYLKSPQLHALVWFDRFAAVTIYECEYHLFLLAGRNEGHCKTDKNYRLTKESILKIQEATKT